MPTPRHEPRDHPERADSRHAYLDPALSPRERTADLLPRLSLEEKVGLMFHAVIRPGPGGALVDDGAEDGMTPASTVVLGKYLNHFNVHELGSARETARWTNALQRLAEQTPHRIPVTISTDPRHAFHENVGTSFAAGSFSQWPEPIGLAALDDDRILEHAQIAREEYVAVGIRMALHPQVDLASDPRWGRQFQTFGSDVERVMRALTVYLQGFQGTELGPDSVACVTKHFPGGGPQRDGEDPHFPYGREQVYPGGRFAEHLAPFRAAITAGTAGMMPYYGMPVGLELDGSPVDDVGFAFNRRIVTDLLRDELGFEGFVVTDWELVHDKVVGGKTLPAKAWGAEHLSPAERLVTILDAGCDQLGGEECVDLLIELVRTGRVPESRIDESARRLLQLKFQLGLFEHRFVDEDRAESVVGQESFRAAGLRAQAESIVVLHDRGEDGSALLPLPSGAVRRVYVEGIDACDASEIGEVVTDVDHADLAVVRLAAPYEPRDDLLFESLFHQGSLDFPPGLIARLRLIAQKVPLVVDVMLERPVVLEPLLSIAAVLTGSFGAGGRAYLAALTGRTPPCGRLPFELPRSMAAVRASREDVPNDTADPLFPVGYTGPSHRSGPSGARARPGSAASGP